MQSMNFLRKQRTPADRPSAGTNVPEWKNRFRTGTFPLFPMFSLCILTFFFLLPGLRAEIDAAPFWRTVTLENGTKISTFLGPVGEIKQQGDISVCAVRPFWSMTRTPTDRGDAFGVDILWPAFIFRDAWHGRTLWFLFYYQTGGRNRQLSYLLPFWFCGRTQENGFSWALFPLWGDIDHFLTYDRMRFCMFPLWWETWHKDVHGESYLWPFINYDKGPMLNKFRVLPFYAYSNQNNERIGQAFLWPFYTTLEYRYPNAQGSGYMFWPFYGHNRIGDVEGDTVLWPLITYNRNLKRTDSFRINAPQPFFRYGKNQTAPGDDILFFWPFYGQRVNRGVQYKFFLWPFFWMLEDRGEEKKTARTWIFPIYWSKMETTIEEEEKISETKEIWPVFSYYQKGERISIRALNPTPVRGVQAIERNLAPLWSILSYESDGGNFEFDFLWGLLSAHRRGEAYGFTIQPFYSFRKGKESDSYSTLFDLFLYRSGKTDHSFRFFFLDF